MDERERTLVGRIAKRLEAVFYETMPDENAQGLRREIGALRDFAELDRLPWPKWIDNVERAGDMDPDTSLRILREGDGDVILEIRRAVRITYADPREPKQVEALGKVAGYETHTIQFCTGQGGGRSPRTHQALCELAVALSLDNADRPLG